MPSYTSLLYSKTGVCEGIPIFHFFALKHRLWVPEGLYLQLIPTINVVGKIIKIINVFFSEILIKFSICTAEKNLCLLRGHVFLMFTTKPYIQD